MNKEAFEKLKKEAEGIALGKDEKDSVRRGLRAFIDMHPVRETGLFRLHIQRSRYTHIIKTMPVIAGILIALLAGGGISAAAEGSLPGDTLYPVKVNVNEEVRAWLALSAEARAEWEAERAERRLDEAAKLAAEGRLDAETRANIEARFEAHAERVVQRAERFEESDRPIAAAEVSSRFEASLRAHEQVLLNLGAEALGVTVGEKAREIASIRSRAEAGVAASADANAEIAAEGALRRAESSIEEARRFVSMHRERLGAEVSAKVEAQIVVAENLMVEGKAKLETGAYGEAFVLFQQALRTVREARVTAEKQVTTTPTRSGRVEITGQVVCLPHRDTSGPQTLECTIGLKAENGAYYGLTSMRPEVAGSITGARVRVEGTLTLEAGTRYATIGTIDVISVTVLEIAPGSGENPVSGETEAEVRGGVQIGL